MIMRIVEEEELPLIPLCGFVMIEYLVLLLSFEAMEAASPN